MSYDVKWHQVEQKIASLWLPSFYPPDWAKSRSLDAAIAWIHRELSRTPRVGTLKYRLRHDCVEVVYIVRGDTVTIIDIDLVEVE